MLWFRYSMQVGWSIAALAQSLTEIITCPLRSVCTNKWRQSLIIRIIVSHYGPNYSTTRATPFLQVAETACWPCRHKLWILYLRISRICWRSCRLWDLMRRKRFELILNIFGPGSSIEPRPIRRRLPLSWSSQRPIIILPEHLVECHARLYILIVYLTALNFLSFHGVAVEFVKYVFATLVQFFDDLSIPRRGGIFGTRQVMTVLSSHRPRLLCASFPEEVSLGLWAIGHRCFGIQPLIECSWWLVLRHLPTFRFLLVGLIYVSLLTPLSGTQCQGLRRLHLLPGCFRRFRILLRVHLHHRLLATMHVSLACRTLFRWRHLNHHFLLSLTRRLLRRHLLLPLLPLFPQFLSLQLRFPLSILPLLEHFLSLHLLFSFLFEFHLPLFCQSGLLFFLPLNL